MGLSAEDREIVFDFINEAQEGLGNAEALLLQLEDQLGANGQPDADTIHSLFRVYHSIKGNAGFLGFQLISALTHQAESLLDRIRKGKAELRKEQIDILFEVCDALQTVLDHLRENGEERGLQSDFSELQERLKQMTENNVSPSANAPADVVDKGRPTSEETDAQSDDLLISDGMKKDFANEAGELLDQVEQDLMALEKNPTDNEKLNRIFRALHTIKGNAGFLGFEDIHQLCHKAETIFDAARAGEVVLQERQISLLLQIVDFIGAALEAIKEGKPPLIAGKNALLDLLDDLVALPQKSDQTSEAEGKGDHAPTKKEISPKSVPKTNAPAAPFVKKMSDVIRVDVQKLNGLMDLVGEIVIAESALLNHYDFKDQDNDEFLRAFVYLQKNIRALQELATSMRMVPLSGLFAKMLRLVRDIANKKGKEAELVIHGEETEVDRSVIEHISDPLIHILRNALDHGIEMPDERAKKGKPRKGKIEIDVQRVGGQIWIKVEDDGRGLDKEKILKRAWQQGLIANGYVPENEQEIYDLIFQPGFSTAEKVTNISGRGVGMDVVRKNIEKIRGSIALSTSPGKGSAITMKIPLTTAVIDGMLIRAGETLYAVPMLDIREAIQLGDIYFIDLIDGQEVVKVRDRLIPLIRLEKIHGRVTSKTDQNKGIVVISEMPEKTVGFLADEIIGEQQLVLKPLPRYLGKLAGVSGCAVLGNGEICFILDLGALLNFLESHTSNAKQQTMVLEA